MRPSLNILDAELIARIVDEAMRVLAEVGMEIRGPEMRRRLLEHGLPLDARRRAGAVPARRRRGGDRVGAVVVHAVRPRRRRRTPTSAATASTSCPARSGLKVLDHRTGETRLADSTDFVEYVRLGDGLGQHPLPRDRLLDQRRHRGPGLGRLAPLHDPDQLEEAGRLGRLHRARRAADGRDDAALPDATGPTSSPGRCRSSRSPRPATSGTARTPART